MPIVYKSPLSSAVANATFLDKTIADLKTGKLSLCKVDTLETGYIDDVQAAINNQIKEHLKGDAETYANPEKYFDEVIEINLSELEPHLNGPFTPDLATPISKMKEASARGSAMIDVCP